MNTSSASLAIQQEQSPVAPQGLPAEPLHTAGSRRAVHAWILYDWANSAYATTIMAAVFPVYYRSLARAAGLSNQDATAAWSYTNSAAMLLIAFAGPILGACADAAGLKKRFLKLFAWIGIVASASLALPDGDKYVAASALFMVSAVGFAGANVFYEALLPHLTRKEDLDQVSAKGYALGYFGGGLLLLLNIAWISFPERFALPSTTSAVRLSFVSVAVWWALFSVPIFRRVPEPDCPVKSRLTVSLVSRGFRSVFRTLREARSYPQVVLFLCAFWIYNDAIATIIKIAVAYGDELGIGQKDLLLALAITQFIGVPFAILFGRLGARIGTKRAILIGIGCYAVISLCGFFMKTTVHFYALAVAVSAVQGGTQALSRSLFARMIPAAESAKFFGLFSTGEKFAGIIGPALFALIGQWGGSSRWGILSLTLLFLFGGILLSRVRQGK